MVKVLPFGIILLAAGTSRRMGEPKQLLPLEGKPLLLHAVEAALDSGCWPVVVVLGAHAPALRPLLARYPVLITENERWSDGMAGSLRAGLQELERFSSSLAGAVIAACDQPALSADLIRRLAQTARETGKPAVACAYAGTRGIPALFRRCLFPELLALEGDRGAKRVLTAHAAETTVIEAPELAMDIDTPEDYRRMREGSATDERGSAADGGGGY